MSVPRNWAPLGDRARQAVPSVLLHLRIDFVAPGEDATGEVDHLRVTGLLEEFSDTLRAGTAAAVDNDFAIAGDFRQALWHVILGNELAANLRDLELVGFANVE